MKFLAFVLFFVSFLAQADIARFRQVAPGIYRGAQPETTEDYRELQALGVRTLLNLRLTPWEVLEEREKIRKLGMRFIHHPYNPLGVPDDAQVRATLRELTRMENQPVFVHCREGKDRTGMIVGLYRVRNEGWTREQAYTEMVEIGFNPALVGLLGYFWLR